MERNWDMEEVSDGRRYDVNDMAKIGCNDCAGCSDCCRGMGDSITLDPLDIVRLMEKLSMNFQQLMEQYVGLSVVDGIILPHLQMSPGSDACAFLNTEGRCSIHEARPGMCRLFPLGRIYEENSFRYFIQIHECPAENKTKEKISRWLDTPDLKKNQTYIRDWHFFLKKLEEQIKSITDEDLIKRLNMYILNAFYITPYDEDEDFYQAFYKRLDKTKNLF